MSVLPQPAYPADKPDDDPHFACWTTDSIGPEDKTYNPGFYQALFEICRLGRSTMHDDCRTTRLSNFRILSNLFFDALPKDHSIFALTEFDITELRQSLRTQRRNGSKLSLFSHVLKAIATTLAANPEFNSIRHGNKLLIYK